MNYVFDDAKNKIEGMSREQIIAAIAEATGHTPQDVDDAFITQLLEQNGNKSIKLWVGKQAEYNLIAEPDENTLYCITDPQETNELQEQINVLQSEINNLIVPDTGNVRGWTIESQTEQADNITVNPVIGGKNFSKDFTLPDGAIVIEVSYIAVKDVPSTVWETDGAYWGDLLPQEEGDPTHYVTVNKDSSFTAVYFKITYAFPSNGDLAELYDIRVGYDGTVYETAGEAVRKQVQSVWFNETVKVALLNLLSKVAYIDNRGQVYFEELQRALYAAPDVESITAVFDQGQNEIYDTDSLEYLRQYLTVTANYKNGTSAEVEAYALSGALEVGTSTITVSYAGKTTTFNVTVTLHTIYGWYYPFNESKVSFGTKDFGFVGNEVYTQGFDERKAYSHIIPTEGDSSTDTQLGMKAVSLTEYPNFGGDFTFSLWCKTQSENFGHPVFATKYVNGNTPSSRYFSAVQSEKTGWTVENTSSNNGLAGFSLQIYTGGKIHFRIFNQALTKSSDFAVTAPSSFDFTQWHHYAVTRKNNTVRLFVDGELVASATTTETTAYAANQIALTAYFGSSAATASDILATGRGELVQDLYIAESCKWESNFDPTQIVY